MWQLHQLERVHETDQELVQSALSDLLERSTELREKMIIGAYQSEEISLGKAAELLNIHSLELRKRFLEQGVPIKIGVESEAAIIADRDTTHASRKAFL